MPALAANQNMGTSTVCRTGTAPNAARTRKAIAKIGKVNRSRLRAGCTAWEKHQTAAKIRTMAGTQLEYGAGNRGCQPPRNSSVATHVMVTMLAYSDMKKQAN